MSSRDRIGVDTLSQEADADPNVTALQDDGNQFVRTTGDTDYIDYDVFEAEDLMGLRDGISAQIPLTYDQPE